jgi:hypothetical protein
MSKLRTAFYGILPANASPDKNHHGNLWNSNRKIRQSRQPRRRGSLKAEVGDIDEPSQWPWWRPCNGRPGVAAEVGVRERRLRQPSRLIAEIAAPSGAMRVRITRAARHGVLARGHARALVANLDQIDRALRAGTSAAPHARALQKQILTFARTGALRDAYALPLEILTGKLIDTIRAR